MISSCQIRGLARVLAGDERRGSREPYALGTVPSEILKPSAFVPELTQRRSAGRCSTTEVPFVGLKSQGLWCLVFRSLSGVRMRRI